MMYRSITLFNKCKKTLPGNIKVYLLTPFTVNVKVIKISFSKRRFSPTYPY